MEVPEEFINIGSFDTLADYYDSISESTSANLIIQDEKDAADVLKEMSLSWGDTGYIAKDGRYTVGRLGTSEEASTLILRSQIDLLGHPERRMNMTEAVNSIKARWNYYPVANFWKSAKTENDTNSQIYYGVDMGWELDMPWVTSETLVQQRLWDELERRANGYPKIAFSISIKYLPDLDLFTRFQLQDPFGIDASGLGEAGREMYVESLAIDVQAGRIDIVAADYL
jgi:hypothetical protein